MSPFRIVTGPFRHHWVLERDGLVCAAGPDVGLGDAQRDLDVILDGRAPPQAVRTPGGWVYAFVDSEGHELGRGLHVHTKLDDCVDECIRVLGASQDPQRCVMGRRRVASVRP